MLRQGLPISSAEIARSTMLKPRSVIRAIQKLEDAKLVEVTRKGGGVRNRYRCLEPSDRMSLVTECHSDYATMSQEPCDKMAQHIESKRESKRESLPKTTWVNPTLQLTDPKDRENVVAALWERRLWPPGMQGRPDLQSRLEPLVEALAQGCGSDAEKMTRGEMTRVWMAVYEIYLSTPDVEAKTVTGACAAYTDVMGDNCAKTPKAVAGNWSRLVAEASKVAETDEEKRERRGWA